MITNYERDPDQNYKNAFVSLINTKQWDWFITIPIGLVEHEDNLLKRLRLIEAELCGEYLVNRYHKLPDNLRYCFTVAFEGEVKKGNRHAHILAYVPKSTKKPILRSKSLATFPSEFCTLWDKIGAKQKQLAFDQRSDRLRIGRANTARIIYACKDVRQNAVAWSRFEFVTPPKSKKFNNENLKCARRLNRQVRRRMGIAR